MTFRRRKTLKSNSILSRAEGISVTASNDGIFLVNSRGGRLYRLNSSGTATWAGISAPIHADDLCQRLGAEFSVDPEAIRSDVFELLSELYRAGLIHVSD